MERKLELADIAGYFPYGLRVQIPNYHYHDYVYHATEDCCYQQVDVSPNAFKVYGIYTDKYAQLRDDLLSDEDYEIDTLKPILRPMTDLVKPMTHPDINNGEEFVPFLVLAKMELIHTPDVDYNSLKFIQFTKDKEIHFQYKDIRNNYISYFMILDIHKLSILNKLHFDYNDLIGNGLAIDINTINQ